MERTIRVRVYELINDGDWDDRGTGNLQVHGSGQQMFVLCEESEKRILTHSIASEIEYELQGQTIITWMEPAQKAGAEPLDLALSFQDQDDCAYTWQWIQNLLGAEIEDSEDPNGFLFQEDNERQIEANTTISIPEPNLNNLETLLDKLRTSFQTRDSGSLPIASPAWFEKLYAVLTQCEEFSDFERCTQVWEILREIVKKGDKVMMDMITLPANTNKAIHIAEYHEHRKEKSKEPNKLRQYMKKTNCLSLPGITLPSALQTESKRLFQLIFLRDVAFLSQLEEQGLSHLNHQIYHINFNIIKMVVEDPSLLTSICTHTKQLYVSIVPQDIEDLLLIVSFLRELVFRTKSVQVNKRRELFKSIQEKGVLHILYLCIKPKRVTPKKHPLLWRYVVESITQILLGIGIAETKKFITSQQQNSDAKKDSDPTLLYRLVETIGKPANPGFTCQLNYLLRAILVCQDATSPEMVTEAMQCKRKIMTKNAPVVEVEAIWRLFHDNHIEQLISFLSLQPTDEFPDFNLRKAQHFVVNILRECVSRHSYSFKHTMLVHSLTSKISKLIQIPQQPNFPLRNVELTLSCLRFFRTCIKSDDDFYLKRLTRDHMLDQCVALFKYNGKRQNLVNSTFLSIFETLSKVNDGHEKKITLYFGDRYLGDLLKIDEEVFREFNEKYKQLVEKEIKEKAPGKQQGQDWGEAEDELTSLPDQVPDSELEEKSSDPTSDVKSQLPESKHFLSREQFNSTSTKTPLDSIPDLLSKKKFTKKSNIFMNISQEAAGQKRKQEASAIRPKKKLKIQSSPVSRTPPKETSTDTKDTFQKSEAKS